MLVTLAKYIYRLTSKFIPNKLFAGRNKVKLHNIEFKHIDYEPAKLKRSIESILADVNLCSMATTDVNQSHINTAFFCYDEALYIYFMSDSHTTHCRNITSNPSMAISIYNTNQPWGSSLKGVQLFGQCKEVSENEKATAIKLYEGRFPLFKAYILTLSKTDIDNFPVNYYMFKTDKIKLFDEDSFGEENYFMVEIDRVSGAEQK
jgi:uncharacterized protein YhbP (UPF0306 family)